MRALPEEQVHHLRQPARVHEGLLDPHLAAAVAVVGPAQYVGGQVAQPGEHPLLLGVAGVQVGQRRAGVVRGELGAVLPRPAAVIDRHAAAPLRPSGDDVPEEFRTAVDAGRQARRLTRHLVAFAAREAAGQRLDVVFFRPGPQCVGPRIVLQFGVKTTRVLVVNVHGRLKTGQCPGFLPPLPTDRAALIHRRTVRSVQVVASPPLVALGHAQLSGLEILVPEGQPGRQRSQQFRPDSLPFRVLLRVQEAVRKIVRVDHRAEVDGRHRRRRAGHHQHVVGDDGLAVRGLRRRLGRISRLHVVQDDQIGPDRLAVRAEYHQAAQRPRQARDANHRSRASRPRPRRQRNPVGSPLNSGRRVVVPDLPLNAASDPLQCPDRQRRFLEVLMETVVRLQLGHQPLERPPGQCFGGVDQQHKPPQPVQNRPDHCHLGQRCLAATPPHRAAELTTVVGAALQSVDDPPVIVREWQVEPPGEIIPGKGFQRVQPPVLPHHVERRRRRADATRLRIGVPRPPGLCVPLTVVRRYHSRRCQCSNQSIYFWWLIGCSRRERRRPSQGRTRA